MKNVCDFEGTRELVAREYALTATTLSIQITKLMIVLQSFLHAAIFSANLGTT